MTNELIEGLKDLISAYDTLENGNDEIRMWRDRYLGTLPLYEDKKFAARIWMMFLYMPSKTMMQKSPEDWIRELEDEEKNYET